MYFSISGKPICIWYVTLRLKVPGPNPMTILDSSGNFGPEEGGWLSIAFKPIMEVSQKLICKNLLVGGFYPSELISASYSTLELKYPFFSFGTYWRLDTNCCRPGLQRHPTLELSIVEA